MSGRGDPFLKRDNCEPPHRLVPVCEKLVQQRPDVVDHARVLALEKLSRDHPGVINDVRPLLHELLTHDGNEAVRRLAVVSLEERIAAAPTRFSCSASVGDDDEQPRELREAAAKVAQLLRRKGK